MADYTDILGQENIIRYMKEAAKTGKLSHAYLLAGSDKSGKMMLANAFAKALQCREGDGVPCDHCRSCLQADNHTHPDIIYVTHEKSSGIRVDDIRKQVISKAPETPYAGPYKIFIIDEAEKMNDNAQNALLKNMEEPPSFVVILLLAENEESLLLTIRSRVMTLRLQPVSYSQIRDVLIEKNGVSEETASLAAVFSDGAVGQALSLAESEDFQDLRETALRLVDEIRDWDTNDLLKAVKEIVDYKPVISEYFDLLTVWYRDVLMYKALQDPDRLIFRDKALRIVQQAKESSYHGIQVILKEIETTKRRIKANVNFELAMETLLMTIKEN